MGFFDTVTDFFSSNDDLFSSALKLGGSAFASYQQSKANDDAAKRYERAQQANSQAILQANEDANARYQDQKERTQDAVSFLRNVVDGDPYKLTPSQQEELARRRETASAQLHSSGLRGAGKAVTAAIKSVENDARGRMIDSNIRRSDSAAGGLASQYFNADTNAATSGLRTAGLVGNNAVNSAVVRSNADIANASAKGQALGDIASIVATQTKDRDGRKSRYERSREELEGKSV